jgi:RNA polymerase sigma-70 factor (ECF subfamily)
VVVQDEMERIARAVSGELEALAGLLEAHGPRVRARLEGRIPTPHRALLAVEDVLQVTYLEAFLRVGGFAGRSGASFGAWLQAIAEHNLQDALRELGRAKRPDPARRARASDPAADLFEGLSSSATTPTRAARRAEASELVAAALARLPRDYAEVLRLYDLEELQVDRVAQRLGRSPGAVHMLRQRARDRLRELLGNAERFLSTDAGHPSS